MENTIKERLLHLMRDEAYSPLSHEELMKVFAQGKQDRKILTEILKELETEGKIYKTRRDKYGVPEKMNLVVGKLSVHPRGFGFLTTDKEDQADIFIPANSMNGAMHGDTVIASLLKSETSKSKMEGEIKRILDRAVKEVVGRYEGSKNFGFVVSDNKRITEDIFVPKRDSNGAKTGDVVVAKITVYPQKGRNPEGKIKEILGKVGQKGVDILSIIKTNNLPEEFPKKVLSQADGFEDRITPEEMAGRMDLRDLNVFSIDGADAKDLDDAISIEKLDNGSYRLGVHIADVSHFVRENTPLDKEAYKRATSVYLVDTVIPMLPQKLSNGLCSLNPDVDRLTLSCIMEIDPSGKVQSHEIKKTVINSKARLVYEDVSDILENQDEEKIKSHQKVLKELQISEELAKILMERRRQRGSVDFDFPESKIVMDNGGNVINVEPYERRIANRMIEEFMLSSNETVAEQFFWATVPFVYRVHESPDQEKIQDFNNFIAPLGYVLKGSLEEIHPKELQKLVEEIKGKKEEAVVSKLLLRSMKQARYSPLNTGHFGLAAKYYCHFTSPIRRYPDLQIHRIIKEYLGGTLTEKRSEQLKEITEKASIQSSLREREAEEAERQIQALRKAEYMEKHIGEEYQGIISSITSFGMFIELENTVEGLVRLNHLEDDYYIFDQERHKLVGEHTGKTFELGDKVTVLVEGVDLGLREINFDLIR